MQAGHEDDPKLKTRQDGSQFDTVRWVLREYFNQNEKFEGLFMVSKQTENLKAQRERKTMQTPDSTAGKTNGKLYRKFN